MGVIFMTDQPKPKSKTLRQPGRIAVGLVAGGAAIWVIALLVVAVALLGGETTGPSGESEDAAGVDTLQLTSQPTASGEQTLAAVAITLTPTATPSPTLTLTVIPSPTDTPPIMPTSTATALPTAMPTLLPKATFPPTVDAAEMTDTACVVPDDWEQYVVQPEDTLFAFVLGAESTVTVEELMAVNCLDSRYLLVDQVIYLPPGAAENAPPSQLYVSASDLYATGSRTPNCPCTIRIIEGWRREQLAAALNNMDVQFYGGDFLAVTDPGVATPYDFVNQRPAGASMEGFLFPGTYTLQNDTTAAGFRDTLLAAFAANVTPQMRADAAAQGVTFYEALIIASIVQREVRTPSYQPLVASIYYNRYRDGSRLGTTVTLQYALGGPDAWWPWVESVNFESPYNTYNRPGLPPTPIDSPGMGAIQAAIYPPQTNYYYHNAACDGSGEVFSETYEEHLKTVNCD